MHANDQLHNRKAASRAPAGSGAPGGTHSQPGLRDGARLLSVPQRPLAPGRTCPQPPPTAPHCPQNPALWAAALPSSGLACVHSPPAPRVLTPAGTHCFRGAVLLPEARLPTFSHLNPSGPPSSAQDALLGAEEWRPGYTRGTRQPQVERPQTAMRGGPKGLRAALTAQGSAGNSLRPKAHWAGHPVGGELTVQQQGQSHPMKAAVQGAPRAATPGPGGTHLGRPR